MQSSDAKSCRPGARPTMQRSHCVSSLVYTVVCFRVWLLDSAYLQNNFVDNVARVSGCSVSGQCFPLWPRSLPFHRPVFYSWRCCFRRVWPWTSAAWPIRLAVDWYDNNYRRNRAKLHSRAGSRPLSARHNTVIRVYNTARNVIETHEHKGDFKKW
jgi:hypothetical protein